MLTKRTARSIVAQIEKHEQKVSQARDDLDEFIGGLENLRYDCEEALEDLNRARDALSRWV